jgi:inosine/xanthosine triphosphate pyrophosphatase family protein/diadenosine tetraphosphate (Ap4A) HIT family hydrolase
MLTLATSNPAKYAPFASQLERLRIELHAGMTNLPELQTLSFAEALAAKARAAAEHFRHPVLVDDAGLVLDAYSPFPGPLTSTVLQSLGAPGLQRLLTGTSDRARMECHLGCWINGALRSWCGIAEGHLDFSRTPSEQRMPLSDLFVPDPPVNPGQLPHRARALQALELDAFDLHLDLASEPQDGAKPADCVRPLACPFCGEFEEDGTSIFSEMAGGRLKSRVVYEDEHFVVMPPLGEFMEGGLLLLTREHLLSLSHLGPELFDHFERLLRAIQSALSQRWGVSPLIFEHGPAPEQGKGVCCVDHAHLNIFPARVQIQPHLSSRMSRRVGPLSDLARLRRAEFGYLFVQENDGKRRAYDGREAPTQLVRRIITNEIGLPSRWHWRDYPGVDELVATFHALKGQIRM